MEQLAPEHPCKQVHEQRHGLLALRVPQAALRRRLPTPEIFENRVISGRQGAGALASGFIGPFWEQCQSGMTTLATDKIVDAICDLLAVAFIELDGEALECSTVQRMWRLRICRYIDQHLGDPELDLQRIVSQFGVSPRYLHKLLSSQDESVSKYVERRRLESAHRCAPSELRRRTPPPERLNRFERLATIHGAQLDRQVYL